MNITADNGKEFNFLEKNSEDLNISIYFAKPYHSWERGANENTNGLIRQCFPKGADFGVLTPKQVMHVQNHLELKTEEKIRLYDPEREI